MSQYLKEVIDPILHIPADEARRQWQELVVGNPDIGFRAKGSDIGRVVVEGLRQGRRPVYDPIFSIEEFPEMREAFIWEFGVQTLGEIEISVPVLVSGCSVDFEVVQKTCRLTEREQTFTQTLSLPAVRVIFTPNDI